MSRIRNGQLHLPAGWEEARDFDGKIYYIDHSTRKTSWIDPRDRLTKPQTFADCSGDELPFGWEEAYDVILGTYFIDHINQTNQIEDPRIQWRQEQQMMLRDYLQETNPDDPLAKQKICNVKQQRLQLAENEVQHLNDALNGWQSRTSLNSNSSTSSTRYDPDQLKMEVANAKARVSQIRCELQQMNVQVCGQPQEYRVNERASSNPEIPSQVEDGGHFHEGPSLVYQHKLNTTLQTDLPGHSHSMLGGRLAEKERVRMKYEDVQRRLCLIQIQLAELDEQQPSIQNEADKDRLLLISEKEELLRELRNAHHHKRSSEERQRLEADKQEVVHQINAAKEEVTRVLHNRIKLQEIKDQLNQQLADMTREAMQLESQLKSISVSTLSSCSSRGSLSTSSRGSLTSSKGSLNSALSYTDICLPNSQYSIDLNMQDIQQRVNALFHGRLEATTPQHHLKPTSTPATATITANIQDNNHKSMTSLSSRSSLSSMSPPSSPSNNIHVNGEVATYDGPPPTYHDHLSSVQRQQQNIAVYLRTQGVEENLNDSLLAQEGGAAVAIGGGRGLTRLTMDSKIGIGGGGGGGGEFNVELLGTTPLSPISEGIAGVDLQTLHGQGVALPRSVSAAVSDESVAGDSGVYEVSNKRSLDCDDHPYIGSVPGLNCAQIQLTLQYVSSEGVLVISLEQLRHIRALLPADCTRFYIRGDILPCPPNANLSFKTDDISDTSLRVLGQTISLPIMENKIGTKTLQLFVCSVGPAQREECVGGTRISLAGVSPRHPPKSQWNNIVNFKLLQLESQRYAPPSSDSNHQAVDLFTSRARRASLGDQPSTDVDPPPPIPDGAASTADTRFRSSSFDNSFINRHRNLSSISVTVKDTDQTHQPTHPTAQRSITVPNLPHYSLDPGAKAEMLLRTGLRPGDSRGGGGGGGHGRAPSLPRSKTFNAGQPPKQYLCKLNRSDSDSAMALQRGVTFTRNSLERRSLRWKQPSAASSKMPFHQRTPTDHEVNLQASKERQLQIREEMNRLLEIKRCVEMASTKGLHPADATSSSCSDILRRLIQSAEKGVTQQHLAEASQHAPLTGSQVQRSATFS